VPDDWWKGRTNSAADPFVVALDRQIAAELYRKVDGFDDGKKQAIHLHYYQALSLRETAKVLGVSTATVKYRLRIAIAQLRKEFERFETERENCL
jgi:RNA polymerase sigma factor (sigma-70 family)